MGTVLIVILFAVGLILTIKGGDWFVDAATWLAEATGIPKFIIGATIVSFATTLPEMLVSAIATSQGSVNMAIGNAIGSVNCNTGIIFALSVLFIGGFVEMKQFRNKGIILILACVATTLLSIDGKFQIWDALIMMVLLILFLIDSIKAGKSEPQEKAERAPIAKKELAKNLVLFVAGAAAMVAGAQLMVDNGEALARLLNVPDIIISITLVAIGTSLPELVTTITAIRKHQSDISVGNIIGANVMDMCSVVPISGIISFFKGGVLTIDPQYNVLHMPFAILVSLIAVVPTIINKKTSKWQGAVLLVVYIAYVLVSALCF